MKIGQITWWRNNYGSILQALALQKKIEEYNHDCEIICQYGKKVTSINNLVDKLKSIGVKATLKKIIGKYTLSGIRKRTIKMEKFVNNHLKISDKEYNEDNIYNANRVYEGFVCGSDQIWNPSLTDIKSMYWLTFAEDKKTIFSYAPSVGVNSFKKEERNIIKENLSKFKGISCREETGTEAINETLEENKCVTVLDPTLLYDKKFWNKYTKNRLVDKKYIFTYLLRGTKEQRLAIKKFAKEKNLIIVTIPFLESDNIKLYDFKFGDIKIWDADPSDFITLIKDAEYIFTDSFHSSIFSSIFHKEFFIFPKLGNNQQNRLINFQNNILLCNRTINNFDDLSSEIKKIPKINWENVDKTIENKRKDSLNYLKKVLK